LYSDNSASNPIAENPQKQCDTVLTRQHSEQPQQRDRRRRRGADTGHAVANPDDQAGDE
jgi:hypothetical protein